MGLELLLVLLGVALLPFIALGFFLHTRVRRGDESELAATWRALAARGGWEMHADGMQLVAREASCNLRLEFFRRDGALATRCVGRPDTATLGRVVISTVAQARAEPTGDAALDAHFSVVASSKQLAATLLSGPTLARLLAFRAGRYARLTLERGSVTLSWMGAEDSEARIREARTLVAGACAALSSTT